MSSNACDKFNVLYVNYGNLISYAHLSKCNNIIVGHLKTCMILWDESYIPICVRNV